jgi:hypothetical protein
MRPEIKKQMGGLRDFGTGATRSKDADGERYDLISPFALKRVAKIMAEGVITHGEANWEKGIPLDATLNHLERHLQLWKMERKTGKKIDRDDHMAKVIWGAMAICHYEDAGPLDYGVLVPHGELGNKKPPVEDSVEDFVAECVRVIDENNGPPVP